MEKQQHNKENKQTLKIFGKMTRVLIFMLLITGCLLVGFFGVKILLILIAQPILTVYNTAFNFYSITNNPSYFTIAANFTKNYLQSLVFLILGAMILFFVKTIKRKMEENEK